MGLGGPSIPSLPSAPPPPPDMADSILRQKDAEMKRKMQSSMGLSQFFKAPNASSPTPPNMGSKTLLGQ